MVGHAFPVFAHFKGGRSILTFVGGIAVVAPLPVAISVGVLLVVFVASRSFEMAARVGMAVLPLVQIAVEGPYRTAATGTLMTFIGLRFAQAARANRAQP
jgi:glycerol-3-phosphate acyltransferase PlsY